MCVRMCVLVCVCACVCVCVCTCVVCVCVPVFPCVFLQDNSKRNRSRNMKFKYIAVNENNTDKFDIRH